jgi:hypothetical protein
MKHQINLPRNLGRVLDQYVEARTTSIALQGCIPSRTVDLTGTARAERAKWARLAGYDKAVAARASISFVLGLVESRRAYAEARE